MSLFTKSCTLFWFPGLCQILSCCPRTPSRIPRYGQLSCLLSSCGLWQCLRLSPWPWQFWGVPGRYFGGCRSTGLCLMVFSRLDWVMGLGRAQREVPSQPLLPGHLPSTGLTVVSVDLCRLGEVRLSGFSTQSLSPCPFCPLQEEVTMHSPPLGLRPYSPPSWVQSTGVL